MKVIIGLGNPGMKYEYTKHNIGFRVVDKLVNDLENKYNIKHINKFNSLIFETTCGGDKVLLVKPLTFMNLSGEALSKIINWYKVNIDNIVIVHDDLDLPIGKVRYREKGSAGGHNGVASIIQYLDTSVFKRVKIGIDRPQNNEVIDYVLSPFKPEEKKIIDNCIIEVSDTLYEWVCGTDFIKIMNTYN